MDAFKYMLHRLNYLPLSREEKLKEINVINTITANNGYDAEALRRTNKTQKQENNDDTNRLRRLHDIPKDTERYGQNLHILEKQSVH
jgi:hypothetical protein